MWPTREPIIVENGQGLEVQKELYMVRILHVIDDNKFMEFCKATFEIDQNVNLYVKSEDFPEKARYGGYDLIIVHYMRAQCTQTLLKEPFKVPVIWFFWGADGFQLGKFHNTFLLPKTKWASLRLNFKKGFSAGMNGLIKWAYPALIDRTRFYRDLLGSIRTVDYIVPVMPGDFDLLRQQYTFKAKKFHLNYVNPMVGRDLKEMNGQNILLGNSASFTNNHLDILDGLKEAISSRPDAKVVLPLNYGNKAYAKYVQKRAEHKLGDQAWCLMDFLPYDQYENILFSCNIMIMNHIRQQAVGNIVFGLLNGIHVYLREESTTYAFLKDEGFHIGRIADLKGLRPLSETEQDRNRELGALVFGKELQHQKVRQLIALALEKKLK